MPPILTKDGLISFPQKGKKKYPSGAILHWDADIDAFSEQTGGVHRFNHAVLSPQFQRNADGSYVNVGAKPAVDTFGGQKWLRSCGAVTNLFAGDTSIARSVTLTAQAYTLQVFGAGTVSCSYGTASVGTPLTFTATAGATLFTPAGATYWMLTATSYPVPYVPPGVTQPASNATPTNGSWFALPDGSPLWQALTGQPLTLATRVRMGVGSGDSGASNAIVRAQTSGPVPQYYTPTNIVASTDGTNYPAFSGVFNRGTIIRRVTQVNTAGTQYRVGYMIEGTHTAIQWSAWVNYDGSMNPSTLYRLMLGYNNAYLMWFNKIAIWKEQVSDARIMEALS